MERYKQLFSKYISNSCNKEELQEFMNWIKDPENENALKNLIAKDWSEFEQQKTDNKTSMGNFHKFLERIEDNESLSEKVITSGLIKRFWQRQPIKLSFRIAASILFPIALGILSYIITNKINTPDTFILNSITTPNGSKTKLDLSDGTIIWLNSGSTLKYPSIFTGKQREVFLTGEGYFEVAKNESSPFIVKTSDLNIKVLGTKFNLKSYPEEGTIETTLIEGSVSISKPDDPKNAVLLRPNEKATFIRKEGRIIQSEIISQVEQDKKLLSENTNRKEKIILSEITNSEQYTAWKDEKLVFRNENFQRICIMMERWYNVKIIINSDELKKYHYTGTLDNENIVEAIKAFQLTVPFRYEINHDVINIWLTNK